MTTKEQERKALEQIRKIVEGLGADSYLATAFEGCFEDAADNIEQDAAYSMKSRAESAERKLEVLKEKYAACMADVKAKEQQIAALSETVKLEEEQKTKLSEELTKARLEAINERKEIKLTMANGDEIHAPVKRFRYIDKNGFRFVNVTEPNEWTTSYKLDDVAGLVIE